MRKIPLPCMPKISLLLLHLLWMATFTKKVSEQRRSQKANDLVGPSEVGKINELPFVIPFVRSQKARTVQQHRKFAQKIEERCRLQLRIKQQHHNGASGKNVESPLKHEAAFWKIMKREINHKPAELWFATDLVLSDLNYDVQLWSGCRKR